MQGKITFITFLRLSLSVIFCFLLSGGVKQILAQNLAQSGCEFTVAWEHFPPFMYIDEQQKLTGFDVEVAEQAFALMNCDVKWLEMPWKRLLVLLESGGLMVVSGANSTLERKIFNRFSVTYRLTRRSLFLRKGRQVDCGTFIACLGGENIIGIQRGYAYGAPFDDIIHDQKYFSNFSINSTIIQTVRQIKSGRIDGLIGNVAVVWYLLELNDISGELIETKIKNTTESEQHYMFSRYATRDEDVAAFDDALEVLQKNGTLRALKNKYKVEYFR